MPEKFLLASNVALSLTTNPAGSGLNITVDNYFERNITLRTARPHRQEDPLEMRSHRGRDLYLLMFLYTPEDCVFKWYLIKQREIKWLFFCPVNIWCQLFKNKNLSKPVDN